MSLYARVYVSQAFYCELQNTKIEKMPNLWRIILKKYLQHFHEWRIFLARIQKLWHKSGHVGTEIHSHTKDFRARGFIRMDKNNGKLFFFEMAGSPYGDKVGYKT